MPPEFCWTGITELFVTDVTYVLLLSAIMLNKKVKILLVSFTCHIKLQNFVITPSYRSSFNNLIHFYSASA